MILREYSGICSLGAVANEQQMLLSGLWRPCTALPRGLASLDLEPLQDLRSLLWKEMGEKKPWEARAWSPLLRCSVQAKAFTLGPSLSYSADMPMPGHVPHWQWLWLANLTSWLDLSSASLQQTSLVIWTWLTLVTITGSALLFVFGYCSIGCLPCQWGPASLAVILISHPHPSCTLKLGLSQVFVQLSNL